MNKYLISLLLIPAFAFAAQCKIVNKQCTDKSATKTINGVVFNLAETCSNLGLTGEDCCWSSSSKYYCGDDVDTCGQYRKNSNCSLIDNTCIDKDYITGNCNKFQSKYSCAGGYQDVESRVCTNVVCANNESATTSRCYSPPAPSADNVKNLGGIIGYMQMAQNMAQDMQCADNNAENCALFSGKYYTCFKYLFDGSQPGSWNNNGADCGLQQEFFNNAGVPTGYGASDRNLYSGATSDSNNVLGGGGNYSLSYDDSRAINNSVQNQQQSNLAAVNQDQNIRYNPNSSSNSSISVKSGQVSSVTINKDLASKTAGFMSFEAYLSDVSVNLAWNRLKGEPDPNNVRTTPLAALGVTRSPSGNPRGWGMGQPEIQGLCIHLADYCDGGNDSGTNSDLIKAEFSYAGGFTNPNFCAACTNELLGVCLSGSPKDTLQQWCCFTSKVALDINVAAYDQGLLNFYTGDGSRYSNQVNHPNNICGGVTVGMISRIDFSRGNYFSDMMSAINVDKLIDTSNFTNANVQGNTQNRSNVDATSLINEWQNER